MRLETFFNKFDELADTANGVNKMRELVLRLATTGHLIPTDGSGWAKVALSEIASARMGKTILKNELSDSGIPVYSAGRENTAWGFITASDLTFRTGTIVVSARGTIGFPKIPAEPEFISTQTTIAITPTSKEIDSGYFCLQLQTVDWEDLTAKTAIPMITVKQVHDIEVRYPHSLAEQKRIVAKVDELMALCDRLALQQQEGDTRHAALARASLARFAATPTPDNLNLIFHKAFDIPPSDLRKSILTLAVQGKLAPQDPNDEPAHPAVAQIETERERLIAAKRFRRSQLPGPIGEGPFDIPETWVWTNLGNAMLNVTDGFHSTPKTVESGVRYVTAKHVKPGLIDFDSCLYVSEDDFKEIASKTRPRKGDVLVVNIGAGSGLASIIEADFEFAFKNVAILNRPEEVDSKFLFNYLVFKRDEIFERQTKGGAQPFLSLGLIRQIPFPLPPLAEQRRIVAKVEQLMALVDALEAQLAASREKGQKLLDAVVGELAGKLDTGKATVPPSPAFGRRGRPYKTV